ncbi:MAG: hypothetical protein KF814_15800 [Nitrospiraceae bacterium]|nr:hypothetical protein [Nitrospiraceae bacterium]
MYDVANFSLADMVRVTGVLRRLGLAAASMEETAVRIVRHLQEQLLDTDEQRPACPLVQCFTTQPFAALPEADREAAKSRIVEGTLSPCTLCWTLLASAGDLPEWNDRLHARQAPVAAITDEEFPVSFPLFAPLLAQFGLGTAAPQQKDLHILLDPQERTFGVFHVPDATASPYLHSTQLQLANRYGIRSVVGFGGLLPSLNAFVLALFTRVPLSKPQIEMFRTIALAAKLAFLPFDGGPVFSSHRSLSCEERV